MAKVHRRIKHMERIPECAPVNKQASFGISHKEYKELSTKPSRFEHLSGFKEVTIRPLTTNVLPRRTPNLKNRRVGKLQVIGWLSERERENLGWKYSWCVRCDCGRFEARPTRKIKKPSKKEYVDACTFCKNAWAEAVKLEYSKTGRVPPGGLPTHRASRIMERRGAEMPAQPIKSEKPRIRIKAICIRS